LEGRSNGAQGPSTSIAGAAGFGNVRGAGRQVDDAAGQTMMMVMSHEDPSSFPCLTSTFW
jgi:hypothetical protein